MGVRNECNNIHGVPGIAGSYCYNCTGRETEAREGSSLCYSMCQWEKPLLGFSPLATSPVLEEADEKRGIGIEQAWVLILPCFS